jgi:hypothetical protein
MSSSLHPRAAVEHAIDVNGCNPTGKLGASVQPMQGIQACTMHTQRSHNEEGAELQVLELRRLAAEEVEALVEPLPGGTEHPGARGGALQQLRLQRRRDLRQSSALWQNQGAAQHGRTNSQCLGAQATAWCRAWGPNQGVADGCGPLKSTDAAHVPSCMRLLAELCVV